MFPKPQLPSEQQQQYQQQTNNKTQSQYLENIKPFVDNGTIVVGGMFPPSSRHGVVHTLVARETKK
jgi:hypothetical protein